MPLYILILATSGLTWFGALGPADSQPNKETAKSNQEKADNKGAWVEYLYRRVIYKTDSDNQ